jgi:preprotein translocase subunit SecD
LNAIARPVPAGRVFVPGGTDTTRATGLDEGEIMTTLGKILVFLVFVAALALGGLMVFVSKTSPSWKQALDERDAYITVLKANARAEAEGRDKWVKEYEKLKQLLDAQMVEAKAAHARLKVEMEENAKQVKEADLQRTAAAANSAKAQAEAKRLQDEVKQQLTVIQEREKTVAKLQSEIITAMNDTASANQDRMNIAARAETLLTRNRELEAQLAKASKKDQPATAVTGPRVNDPNYTNPPQVYVKGTIKEVDDKDKKLVRISLGSDNGIRKDQTLEVYRMNPKAEYLGRLLIVDADFRTAVARLLPQPGAPSQVTLLPGDEVASKLRPN